MNDFYFQIEATEEQIEYTNKIVDYSIENHPVTDIFANDPNGNERQREFRFTGSLGEVVFADVYKLPRPQRSFGAIDGQDFGQDFIMKIGDKEYSFDIKSMGRRSNDFRENYVLNLPKYQMEKANSKTDYYFCINIHQEKTKYIVSFVGYIKKEDILKGKVGILYNAGTKRIKDNGDSFIFQRDTYEVFFKDIVTPFVSDQIKKMQGYKEKRILPAIYKK